MFIASDRNTIDSVHFPSFFFSVFFGLYNLYRSLINLLLNFSSEFFISIIVLSTPKFPFGSFLNHYYLLTNILELIRITPSFTSLIMIFFSSLKFLWRLLWRLSLLNLTFDCSHFYFSCFPPVYVSYFPLSVHVFAILLETGYSREHIVATQYRPSHLVFIAICLATSWIILVTFISSHVVFSLRCCSKRV